VSDGLELRYFVLKPSGKGDHGKASRAALRAYAEVIANTDQRFANDLENWATEEQLKAAGLGETGESNA